MLYFSAHWCPPCRKFTPVLSEAYTKLKAERDDFELVFVSSDRDQEGFDEYFGEMTLFRKSSASRASPLCSFLAQSPLAVVNVPSSIKVSDHS